VENAKKADDRLDADDLQRIKDQQPVAPAQKGLAVGQLIRTRNFGCFINSESPAWGQYLLPADDPLGKRVSWKRINAFMLKENFPKVPKHLWAKIISLYFHFCDPNNKTVDESTEVSVLLLRSEDDFSKWRVLVPEQEVGGAYVKAKFDLCCDIETGELIKDNFPPPGWVHAGSSHSHNTMPAFFSSVDDEAELSVPGLHVVVGKIDIEHRTYQLKASVVLRGQRRYVDHKMVIEMDGRWAKFHPNVLSVVNKKEPEPIRFGPGGGPWWRRPLVDDDGKDNFVIHKFREQKDEADRTAEDKKKGLALPFSLETMRLKQDLTKLDDILERLNGLPEYPEEVFHILARHGVLPTVDD
jgi:hypothetical protein